MPSIFIWKSDSPNLSNDTIKMYYGSNWILEEHMCSTSYEITDQSNIMYNDMNIIINNITNMPTDWVGNTLLKCISVPYKCIKQDNYAKYEQIGIWNRVTIDNVIDNYTIEFEKIHKWVNNCKQVQNDTDLYVKENKKVNNKSKQHDKKQRDHKNIRQGNINQKNINQKNKNQENDKCLINFNIDNVTKIKLNTINNSIKFPTLKSISIPLRPHIL